MAKSRIVEQRRKYVWPESQFNFWLLVMFASAATELGIFAYFITVQNTLRVGTPWYVFPPSPPLSSSLPHPTRSPSGSEPALIRLPQAVPLPNRLRRPDLDLASDPPGSGVPTAVLAPVHGDHWIFHRLRALAHRTDPTLHHAVRARRQCRLILQSVSITVGSRGAHIGLVADEPSVSGLARGVCDAGGGHGLLAVDDGHVMAGQPR